MRYLNPYYERGLFSDIIFRGNLNHVAESEQLLAARQDLSIKARASK